MKKRWIYLLLTCVLALSACGRAEQPAPSEPVPVEPEESPVVESPEPVSEVCELYLQVLADLWEVDSGLNGGITCLGLDLSGVTDLTKADREYIAWEFGAAYEMEVLPGGYEDLREGGYLEPYAEGTELFWWEDGVLFVITGSAEDFDAHKWRSPLGAYFFSDCSGEQNGEGRWSYEIGSEMIS